MNQKVFVELKICRGCLNCNTKLIEPEEDILRNFNFLLNNEQNNSSSNILPKTFCEKCIAKIKVSANFKKQSQESEKYLLSFLSKINLEFTTSLSNLSRNQQQQDQDLDYLLQDETIENDNKSQESSEIQEHPEQKMSTSFTLKEEPNKSTIKLSRSNSVTKINEKSPIKMMEKPKTQQQIVTIEKVCEPSTHSVTAHLNIDSSDLYDEEQHIEEDDNIFDDKEIYDIMEIDGNYVDEAGNPILESSNGESCQEDDEGGEFILVNYKSSEDLSTDKDQQFIVEEMYNSTMIDEKPLRKKHMKRMPKEIIERYAQSTDNNQHICTKCVKVFSTRTNLIRHIQSHDGNKPYVCDVCQKGFTQSGSLKQHMYIHSGQRPYKCTFCDRAFTQGKTLKFHLRKHMDEKPFICSECNGAFRQRDGLKRHLKTRHNIELKYERPNQLDEKIIAYVNMDDKSQSDEKSEILEIIEESENKQM
ncbi:zinc finger and BTB domain-containing protein 14-like [Chironomus tepperi]|uniref:zinc finger and BTB domain-containing protein 14-like n=1 Tax=Chironomus tepperi TaxID=113505 RepID=UPI00391F8B9B